MTENEKLTLSHREVAIALIRYQDLHEGLWQLTIEFGATGANVGPDSNSLLPTILVPIKGVGLTRVTEKTNLSVDAADVNPAPAVQRKAARKGKALKPR